MTNIRFASDILQPSEKFELEEWSIWHLFVSISVKFVVTINFHYTCWCKLVDTLITCFLSKLPNYVLINQSLACLFLFLFWFIFVFFFNNIYYSIILDYHPLLISLSSVFFCIILYFSSSSNVVVYMFTVYSKYSSTNNEQDSFM